MIGLADLGNIVAGDMEILMLAVVGFARHHTAKFVFLFRTIGKQEKSLAGTAFEQSVFILEVVV